MILRKPYAFLIKNFKRIHFVIALLMSYLVYKSSVILEYLNRYINDGWLNNSNIVISEYLTLITFVMIVLVMILLGVILILLKSKKKPALFYIASIGMLIATIVVYLLVLSDLNIILVEVIDPRKIRITRDLVMMAALFQFVNVIFAFVRATGFNIKKFDFERDLKSLNITAKDYEEIELTLKIDTNEIKRRLRRSQRKFRYFVLENFVLFILFIVFISVILGIYIFLSVTVYNKSYLEGVPFNTTEGVMTINKTYYTELDYKGNKINENNGYLVVNFNLNNMTDDDVQLDPLNFVLFIDDEGYSPTSNKYLSMKDYGIGYDVQVIEKENTEEFIIVFEIDKAENLNNIMIKYIDYYKVVKIYELETNYKDIVIDPIINGIIAKTKSYILGETIDFSNTYLDGEKITINSYEFNNRYDDNGLIRAYNLSDYDKTLLKLEINYEGDIAPGELIETYGIIKYYDNDEYVAHRIPLVNKTTSESEYTYIEVLEEVKESKKVELVLETREGAYTYTLIDE